MSRDRITQLRIRGMRAIADVTLDLKGLTVLIGDNGSGKSTVLEALELLRQAAKPVNFVSDVLVRAHGGLENLLRRGARELKLGVTVEGAGPKLEYDFTIANVGNSPEVMSEDLKVVIDGMVAIPALSRLGRKGSIVVPGEESQEDTFHAQVLAAAGFGFTGKWCSRGSRRHWSRSSSTCPSRPGHSGSSES